jgi:hypothetical protein
MVVSFAQERAIRNCRRLLGTTLLKGEDRRHFLHKGGDMSWW